MKYLSIIFVLVFAFSVQTFALDLTVNLTTDQHDANANDNVCDIDLFTPGNQCSLRAAIEFTININFEKRILFNLPANSTITLTEANGGELFINPSYTEIVGTGANNLTIDGGAGTNRVFYVNQATTTISGVRLTGGNGTGGNANDNNSGGAIFARGGTLTLNQVYITGNSTLGVGGGVQFSEGTHRITNSTIANNVAGGGGGIANIIGTLVIDNSTISNNIATGFGFGGGIFSIYGGVLSLRSVTITKNSSIQGGGVFQDFPGTTTTITNSIIAGNTASNGTAPDIFSRNSTFTSLDNNVVGDSPGDAANTNTPISFQTSDILDTNPLLDSLAFNGGTTPTHILLPGSPVINAGNNSNSPGATDQRGFARIFNGFIDIGAVESDAACTYSLSTPSINIPANGGGGSFTITTPSGCSYSASTGNDFISIDSGATGTGTTNINFFVQANTTGTARMGTITVGNQTFTINQAAGKSRKRIRFIQ